MLMAIAHNNYNSNKEVYFMDKVIFFSGILLLEIFCYVELKILYK